MSDPASLRNYLRVAPLSRALIRSREIELIAGQGLSGRILDLGFGDGHFAAELERSGIRSFVGMDMSLEELRRARGRTAAHLVVGDMEHAPFRPGVFDGALSNCVLEHVVDIDAAFREAARVLKPSGTFLATVVADQYENLLFWPRLMGRFGFRSLARRYLDYLQHKFVHRRYIGSSEWKKVAQEAGLRTDREQPYVGQRRQMLMDVALPGVLWGRVLRTLVGREVISPVRWPAGPLRRWLDAEDANPNPRSFANVFLVLKK